ncbi:MAG: leucyl/phenylalanyl-tRNA--protein transferase [Actinomycetota bacterium]
MPIEPPMSPWRFSRDAAIDEHGLVGIGADAEPGTILAAYRNAMFPMPIEPNGEFAWWSPNPRGVLELDDLHVSRSLRRSMRRFEFRVDTAFSAVVDGCADPTRAHGWIDDRIRMAYQRLHDLGWAHSIETWLDGELVGGLYGLGIGGLFAAESKFHRVTDASKAAVAALVHGLKDGHPRLVDVQWQTDHLATLGVSNIDRNTYLARLPTILSTPDASLFARNSSVIIIPRA